MSAEYLMMMMMMMMMGSVFNSVRITVVTGTVAAAGFH